MAMTHADVAKSDQPLGRMLNEQLANWAVVYFKLHHFHWYVKGPNFQDQHKKFEELYNMAAANLDELAERMLAIGLQPASTMQEYLSLATVKESAKSGESANEMLAGTASDFGKMAEGMKKAAAIADEAKDGATADMLYGHIEALEKQMWMLNATLGK
jgi:starvation-inducible DNA-binding protein